MSDNCPQIDGYIIHRQGCQYRVAKSATVAAESEPASNPDAEEMACAWSDYRSEYGASGAQAHKAFSAGWKAAREGDRSGVLR